jgi:transcription elongation factor Elf1
MTTDEWAEFDGSPDHSNHGSDCFCCPYCVEGVAVSDADENVKVAACSNCGQEFAVWTEMVPRAYSAKMPTAT